MGKVRLRENWLAQSPQGVLTPTLVLLPAGGDELKRGDQISSRLQSLNVRATSWGRSSLKGFVKPGQVIESSSLEVSVSPTGRESQTSGTFTCMRVTCGYCENAGSGSFSRWGLRLCISDKIPGDANTSAADECTYLEQQRCRDSTSASKQSNQTSTGLAVSAAWPSVLGLFLHQCKAVVKSIIWGSSMREMNLPHNGWSLFSLSVSHILVPVCAWRRKIEMHKNKSISPWAEAIHCSKYYFLAT